MKKKFIWNNLQKRKMIGLELIKILKINFINYLWLMYIMLNPSHLSTIIRKIREGAIWNQELFGGVHELYLSAETLKDKFI